jgi:hypothetical protein
MRHLLPMVTTVRDLPDDDLRLAPMTKARRSPWLDERTALLVSLLADRHHLTVTEDAARQDISDDLDHLARLMRIGRQAAKMYVTDEAISDMADRIAAAVAEHRNAAAGELQGVVDLNSERRRRRRPLGRSPEHD